MKRNSYETAGYISICYFMFIILARVFGWFVLLYTLSTFKNLLSDKTRSNLYDKPISLIFNIIIFMLVYTPIANFLLSNFMSTSILLAIQFLIIAILGVSFILFGLKLNSLEDSLYSVKGQLTGATLIVGACYILNGLLSFIYILASSEWLQPIARLSGMLSYAAPILFSLALGSIFLKAAKEVKTRKMSQS